MSSIANEKHHRRFGDRINGTVELRSIRAPSRFLQPEDLRSGRTAKSLIVRSLSEATISAYFGARSHLMPY